MKTLYFDVETTGLSHINNEICQLSYIIDIDDTIVLEENAFLRPLAPDRIDPAALTTQNRTIEELLLYPLPKFAFNRLIFNFSKHINKYDKKDKLTPCAANGHFDLDFLNSFFLKHNDNYFGSWQNWQLIDPIAIARILTWAGRIPQLENYKLSTLCKHFSIPLLNAHDSMEDTRALRLLAITLRKEYLQ